MKPLFSIVTPSLNQGAYLSECLNSVADERVEHWVMDGGSTDGTLSLLEAAPRVSWISEPDNGQTDAINKGFARARGDILSYLCADDYLEPRTLDRVQEAFQNPSVDVVYGDGFFLEGNSGWKRRKAVGEYSYARLRRGNFLIQPAVFFRRRVLERFGPLDARLQFCMDHEYWLRIGAGTRWLRVPEALATCRLHADAKTSRQLVRAWDEARRMQAAYGLRMRPMLDAVWMRLVGSHYYLAKRRLFAWMGRQFFHE